MKTVNMRLLGIAAATLLLCPAVQAQEHDNWLVRVGVGSVDPKSDNGDIASVDSGTTLVFNGVYMLNQNVGVEVLASLPFSHDIKLAAGGTKVGETKHLPPTVSLQYYFNSDSALTPYVGAGLNYTLFFDEKTSGPLAGADLELDPSFGLAVQAGIDFDISDSMFVNLDLRWIDISTDAELDGAPLETVEIDPLVYSLTVGWRF